MKRVWIFPWRRSAEDAITALKLAGDEKHNERHRAQVANRLEEAKRLGADAERYYEGKIDFEEQLGLKGGYVDAITRDDSVSNNSAPVQQIRIELPEKVERTIFWMLPALLAFTVITGLFGVMIGMDITERERMEFEFQKLDRQYRMTELKLDDWTVVAHRAGLQLPGDYTRGPQGNLDAESFHIKPKGK